MSEKDRQEDMLTRSVTYLENHNELTRHSVSIENKYVSGYIYKYMYICISIYVVVDILNR